jgi:hypothetical protein
VPTVATAIYSKATANTVATDTAPVPQLQPIAALNSLPLIKLLPSPGGGGGGAGAAGQQVFRPAAITIQTSTNASTNAGASRGAFTPHVPHLRAEKRSADAA